MEKKKKFSKEKRAIIAFWPVFLITILVILLDLERGIDGYGRVALYLPAGVFLFETIYYKVFKTGAFVRSTNWWRNSLRRLAFEWICFAASLIFLVVYHSIFAAIQIGFSAVPKAAAEALLGVRWLGNYLLLTIPLVLFNWEVVHRPGINIEMDDGEYDVLEAYHAEDTFYLLSDAQSPLKISFYKVIDDETMELATELEARELYPVAKRTIYQHILKRVKSIDLGQKLIFSKENYPRVNRDG